MVDESKLQCYHKGCGLLFDPKENDNGKINWKIKKISLIFQKLVHITLGVRISMMHTRFGHVVIRKVLISVHG